MKKIAQCETCRGTFAITRLSCPFCDAIAPGKVSTTKLKDDIIVAAQEHFGAVCWKNELDRRRMKLGLVGQADITGSVTVLGLGVRLEIEAKNGQDKQRKDQETFEALMLRQGCIYIIADGEPGYVDRFIERLRAAIARAEKVCLDKIALRRSAER